jgi:hypothetical protein
MSKQPTDAQIETAIEWLRCFDGAAEPENGADIAAVTSWLNDMLRRRMLRRAGAARAPSEQPRHQG